MDRIDGYYYILRGCGEMCDPGACDYHEDTLPGDIICAKGGEADHLRL